MRKAAIIAILIATAGSWTSGRADSLGARVDVTATVLSNCRLTIEPLSFGTYDPMQAHSTQPADASTTMTVNCTKNTSATVAFDLGRNGSSSARVMSGPGADRLDYQIFRDSARSQVWASGADAVTTTSTGFSNAKQLTVFGRILPRQEVEPGAYTDVLTATVDF
jgi:spore coat protein U-like protein